MNALTRPRAGPRRRNRPRALDPSSSLLLHDVKNLSFRLGALLRNLEDHYEDPLFRKSVIEVLSDTIDQMDRIVRRSRDRSGQVLVKFPLDLNEILSGVVERLPRQTRHRLLIEERYSRIPKIWGDMEYLRDAFAIVVQNAVEAIRGADGRLRIATRVIMTRAGRRRVVVSISDTGCGMSREFVRTTLFSPFATTKEHGLGMGLYTCRNIIAMHDGAISVSSREGHGTTFRFSFRAGG
ncbi:MAG: ATP-binding protein [Acidobacteriota bacterium]